MATMPIRILNWLKSWRMYFNVQLTWLSPSVYGPKQEDLLMAMTEEVANTKDSYNYKKAYTLEDFYGMLIK